MHMYSTRSVHRAGRSCLAGVLLALLLPWQAGHAEPLGRLFFTPAERTRLDQRVEPERPVVPPPRLDGIITRSAGRPTLFLDGQATAAGSRQVRIGEASAEVTGADGRSHRLRVGAPPPDADTP